MRGVGKARLRRAHAFKKKDVGTLRRALRVEALPTLRNDEC
jgi:hypothetical protein